MASSKTRNVATNTSLREHPFLLALRRWGRFARRNVVPPRETSSAAKSEEKGIYSQATPTRHQLVLQQCCKKSCTFLAHFTVPLWHRAHCTCVPPTVKFQLQFCLLVSNFLCFFHVVSEIHSQWTHHKEFLPLFGQ